MAVPGRKGSGRSTALHPHNNAKEPRVFDAKSLERRDCVGCAASVVEALDALHIGLSVLDRDLRLVATNTAFLRLLDFPPELGRAGTPLEAVLRFNAERGEYGEGDVETLIQERLALARKFEAHRFERSRPDGTVLEITGNPLTTGGFVTTYSDVTEIIRARKALEKKERELRRHVEDLKVERALVEKQAQQMVHMAEDLAVQNKEIEKSRQFSDYQARHDELTGLPNRRYFYDYLQQTLTIAGAAGAGKALLFVDLDNFKQVNDRLGHDVGDALLRRVALRLTSSVRDSDFVTRLGGDEFAVLLAVKQENDVTMVAERILDSLALTVEEADPPITTGASIGAALYPQDGENREALLRSADTAMYEAKHRGRNCLVFAGDLTIGDGAEQSPGTIVRTPPEGSDRA